MSMLLSRFTNKEVLVRFKTTRTAGYRLNSTKNSESLSENEQQTSPSINEEDPDMPDSSMQNPYVKEKKLCFLCETRLPLDYKNPRFLSQFISQFTGQVYNKKLTGLCEQQYQNLLKEVSKSKFAGFMPFEYKDLQYVHDPKLFDPFQPPRR